MSDSGLQEGFWECRGHVSCARGTESITGKYRNTGRRLEKYRERSQPSRSQSGPRGGLPRAPDGLRPLAVVRPVLPKGRTAVFG